MSHSAIRKHIYDQAGIPDKENGPVNYEEAKKNTWSIMNRFFTLCANRILMGRFRYGQFKDQYYDYVEDIKRCLKKYEQTRNTEFLVDLSNYAWIEFQYGTHPQKHFQSIDDGEHSKQ